MFFNTHSKQEPEGQGKVNISRQLKSSPYWDKSYTPPLIPPFLLIHPSPILPGLSHLIQAEINTWPLRQALNKQWREKHGPASKAKAPPSPLALCTTQSKWTHYFSSNFIQPTGETSIQCFSPQGCSDVSSPAVIHSNVHFHTHGRVRRLMGVGTNVYTHLVTSMGSIQGHNTCSLSYLQMFSIWMHISDKN